jgi:hypothetical protein
VKARIAKKVAMKAFFLSRMKYKISTVKTAMSVRGGLHACFELWQLQEYRKRLSKRDAAIHDAMFSGALETL